MGLYNNVPTFTYVSASGITVTYNEEVYTVQSFYTNKKYIYWDYDNATVLQASNTMPTRSFKTHLVIINDNGVATVVPPTYDGFEISFNGDTDEAIKSRIYALYEKNKEFGDKFVAIEQDVDGIRQIVGSSDPNGDSILDRISKIEQTSEDINLSVEEVKKQYADDKELSELRENLNSSFINLNADLGTFSCEMSDYYKDNKISQDEKMSIDTTIEQIISLKSQLLLYIDKVKLVAQENGNTAGLNALNSGISALDIAHTNLIQNINTAISDYIITPSEKTVIIDAFAKYNLKINELKNTCDEIVFLGIGGVVSEKLAQISMTSNQIKLSVSSVESTFNSELNAQKAELESQVNDVVNSLDNFKDSVETTFKDGIIDEAEKKVLSEKLEQLEKEKLDIVAQYESIYGNENLEDNDKKSLKTSYDNYISKHSSLKNKITEVINAINVSDSDLTNIKTLFSNYSTALGSLNVALSNALESISANKSNAEILKAKK